MAKLELAKIKELIDKGRPEWIKEAEKEYKQLQVHVNGIGLDDYLRQISNAENEKQFKARKELAISNRHLFANILRPVDKIFSAKGGSISYNCPESQKKQLIDKLANIRHGLSLRRWIQEVQINRFYVDPAGLTFFEWKDESTFPVIKAITSIFNYKTDGRNPEWIIFQPEQKKDGYYYRVIDDAFDYTVKVYRNQISIIEDETFANPWGKVPAYTNSGLINPELTHKESPLADLVEMADSFLRVSSIKQIYQNLHLYPIFWAYVEPCRTCEGTGLYEGQTCHTCNGDRHTFKKDVTDVIKLKPPTSNDEPRLAPDVAGYVQPDLGTFEEMRTELKEMERAMTFTMWGTVTNENAENETATGRWLDVQPVNDRLNKLADVIEELEQWAVDITGKFYFPNFKGSSINYGRRFMVETPTAIWAQYNEAREKNAPKDTLDYLLNQYYQSEFNNDKETLSVYEKLFRIEPFIHKTDEQVQGLTNITNEDKKAKAYYSEWKATKTWDELVLKTYEQLLIDFKNYLNGKEVQRESPQTIPGTREGME
jgi:hypothetical protein